MFNLIINFLNNIKNFFFPFYRNKDLKLIFKKLQEGIPKDKIAARFVGGCVRKYLSNEKVDDIDIATVLTTTEIKEKFKDTNLKVIDTGVKHGTLTIISENHKVELTTLRKDIKTDGRHAEVEFIDNWKKDSERRDFTINAIYMDINGKLFDPQMGTIDLKNKNIKFIDLSADFRINDPKVYQQNYKISHKAKDLIKHSLYSIPELNKREFKNKRIISNPGCYPTSIQIPLVPLIKKNLIKINNISIDSKSGYSGAGKNLEKKFTHKNLYSSVFAYGIKNHRHVCEIEQQLLKLTRKKINFTFNPYLLPTFRGILTTIYINTKKGVSAKLLRNNLIKFYKNSKFIKILKLNSPLGSGNVLNTNSCEISICETRSNNKVVIFSALDNLVKGAAGQAIQNMNLMFKFSENLGLK